MRKLQPKWSNGNLETIEILPLCPFSFLLLNSNKIETDQITSNHYSTHNDWPLHDHWRSLLSGRSQWIALGFVEASTMHWFLFFDIADWLDKGREQCVLLLSRSKFAYRSMPERHYHKSIESKKKTNTDTNRFVWSYSISHSIYRQLHPAAVHGFVWCSASVALCFKQVMIRSHPIHFLRYHIQ